MEFDTDMDKKKVVNHLTLISVIVGILASIVTIISRALKRVYIFDCQ